MNKPILHITRGNVDGIITSALQLSRDPQTTTWYTPHLDNVCTQLRQEPEHKNILITDLSLTESSHHHLEYRLRRGHNITILDHHKHNYQLTHEDTHINTHYTAAGNYYKHYQLSSKYAHLVAIADAADRHYSHIYHQQIKKYGKARIHHEMTLLDYAWRYQIHDDEYRHDIAQHLARGHWPSSHNETIRRYEQINEEQRWEQAIQRVQQVLTIHKGLAILDGNKIPKGLNGFGTRAAAHVAELLGADIIIRYLHNPANNKTYISLRRCHKNNHIDLGKFLANFAHQYGYEGGGHPTSGGGAIPLEHTPTLLKELKQKMETKHD